MKKNHAILILVTTVILLIGINSFVVFNYTSDEYPSKIHKNITVTVFWAGEGASGDNMFISNTQSAWDENWMEHYGGVDDPMNRDGYYPADFVPLENPFYFALPYKGVKNSWIKITKNSNTCYAQWEDVGPFETNDYEYVFEGERPKNDINDNAGLDVSPAVRDCLGFSGMAKVDWEFVDFEGVPDGPWREIITTR